MIYCFLADGFEEIEALATIDILRRAEIEVTTVGVGGKVICASHGIPVTADITLEQFQPDDKLEGVILPGGMPGTKNLLAAQGVRDAVTFAAEHGRLVCAICAAPMILGRMGILSGKKATCFPGFENELAGASVCTDKVVVDGKVITGKGAGCALEFGFAITAQLKGEAVAESVAASMQCR
ncbi:DJ-1 family glyoxalase III [Ruminococcus sp.]|uniref:DJ-1 family glyoxalase III n=1 Tax=Ruminococcus sp. TaxID=41978 RepID=UPI00388E3C63